MGKGRGGVGGLWAGLGVVKKRKDGERAREGGTWNTQADEQKPACGGGDAQAILQPVLSLLCAPEKGVLVASALLWSLGKKAQGKATRVFRPGT